VEIACQDGTGPRVGFTFSQDADNDSRQTRAGADVAAAWHCKLGSRCRAAAALDSPLSVRDKAPRGALFFRALRVVSDVEAEVHDVAVLDDVFLAFERIFPASLAPCSPLQAMKSLGVTSAR
jgi:hypothetical protein